MYREITVIVFFHGLIFQLVFLTFNDSNVYILIQCSPISFSRNLLKSVVDEKLLNIVFYHKYLIFFNLVRNKIFTKK